jgi:F-box domain
MMRENHVIFNDLPIEMINLIFENIKIKDLRRLRFICSYWSKIIREIIDLRLGMEKLHILNEKKINAININEIPDGVNEGAYDYYSIFTNVYLYYTKNNYLLNKLMEDEEIIKFICKKLKADNLDDHGDSMPSLRKISCLEFLNDVEKSCNYHEEMVWKIMINITNSDFIMENDSHKNNFLRFFINSYELYSFHTVYSEYIESTPEYENHKELYESFDYLTTCGIIMVYPDKKTFSLHYRLNGGHL